MSEAGALSVIEVDGIVAATSPGQEADTRAALNAPESAVENPTPRETPTPPAEAGEDDGAERADAADAAASEPKRNPRKDAYARMQEATKVAAVERARANQLEARIRDLEARQSQPTPPQPEPTRRTEPVQGEKFPNYDEYLTKNPDASWDEWNDAKIDWKADQRVTAYQRSLQAEREQAQARETWTAHTARIERSRDEKYPDFDAVIDAGNAATMAAGLREFPPAMLDAIVSSTQSDDLLYFLGTHPDEAILLARRFANRPVTDAEFVRDILELKVAATAGVTTGSASPAKHYRAAAPPNPVGSSAPAPSVNGLGSLDPDSHIEAYRRSEAAKQRR